MKKYSPCRICILQEKGFGFITCIIGILKGSRLPAIATYAAIHAIRGAWRWQAG